MVTLEFIHVPEGRVQEFGPYSFVQVTYDVVRVGPEGDTEIAGRESDGCWYTADKRQWTDFTVFSAE